MFPTFRLCLLDDTDYVYYYVTGFLEKALSDLRKDDKKCILFSLFNDRGGMVAGAKYYLSSFKTYHRINNCNL